MTKSFTTTETTATTTATTSASTTTTTVQPTTMSMIAALSTASNASKSVTEEDATAVLSGAFHSCYSDAFNSRTWLFCCMRYIC